MISKHRFLPAAAIVVVSLTTAYSAEVTDAELGRRLEAYIAPFVEAGNFSGAVLVAQRGRVRFKKAYGMANYELQVPNSPETRFHIASVSKPFTAAAILQLQEQKRLNISDSLSKYVPEFVDRPNITLDHLLTHTSGIHNVNDLGDYDVFARSPHTVEELVAKFSRLPLDFQPGADYHYSNSNYNLLALVIERVSGEEYGDYIRKHLLEPAGMKDSGHDGEPLRLIPHVAGGYQPAGVDGYEKASYLDWSNKAGNGSLYSTLEDLYRFDRALNGDVILKAETRQKYFVEGRGNRYGWFNRTKAGHRVMSSNGRSPGFTAELDRYIDDDVTIIVLSNSYATTSQDPIAQGLAAIVFGQEPPKVLGMRTARISQPVLDSYGGNYQYGGDYFVPNARFTLSPGPGYLLLQLGTFRTPLVPLSETRFVDRNLLGNVVITTDDKKAVTGLTYEYSGKQFAAKRVEGR